MSGECDHCGKPGPTKKGAYRGSYCPACLPKFQATPEPPTEADFWREAWQENEEVYRSVHICGNPYEPHPEFDFEAIFDRYEELRDAEEND